MKQNSTRRLAFGSLLAMALVALLSTAGVGGIPQTAFSQESQAVQPEAGPYGYAFTYQGQLKTAAGPVNGACDFQFSLWNVASGAGQVGTTLYVPNVTLVDGLFTARLDFGAAAHTGEARWLEIAVRCPAGSGTYTTLTPRQELTAAPAALALALPFEAGGSSGDPLLTFRNSTGAALELASQNDRGLYVSSAGSDGLYVGSAGSEGLQVGSTGGHGVYVANAALHGYQLDSAGHNGMNILQAADDGVYVERAGTPSTIAPGAVDNGFEVAGAAGNGLYVGRADQYGVYVQSASGGVNVHSAGNNGLWVDSAGTNGLWVASAGASGVYVENAATHGVYANTTNAAHEWGFYTPDKIYAGTTLASGGPLLVVAQNGDGGNLESGNLVAVSGVGAILPDAEAPVPLVRRSATNGSPVLGVVYRRLVVEEKAEEKVDGNSQMEQQTFYHTNSADGPAAPGDYLLVVVLGAAQVKVEATAAMDLRPGDLLAAAPNGQATKAAPVRVGETTFYAPGTVFGQVMGAVENGLIWVWINPR